LPFSSPVHRREKVHYQTNRARQARSNSGECKKPHARRGAAEGGGAGRQKRYVGTTLRRAFTLTYPVGCRRDERVSSVVECPLLLPRSSRPPADTSAALLPFVPFPFHLSGSRGESLKSTKLSHSKLPRGETSADRSTCGEKTRIHRRANADRAIRDSGC